MEEGRARPERAGGEVHGMGERVEVISVHDGLGLLEVEVSASNHRTSFLTVTERQHRALLPPLTRYAHVRLRKMLLREEIQTLPHGRPCALGEMHEEERVRDRWK
jgi:hypothetical protein